MIDHELSYILQHVSANDCLDQFKLGKTKHDIYVATLKKFGNNHHSHVIGPLPKSSEDCRVEILENIPFQEYYRLRKADPKLTDEEILTAIKEVMDYGTSETI